MRTLEIKIGDSIVFICQNTVATAKVVQIPSEHFRYFKVTLTSEWVDFRVGDKFYVDSEEIVLSLVNHNKPEDSEYV